MTVSKYAGGCQLQNTRMNIDPRLWEAGLELLSRSRAANTWKASKCALNVITRLEGTYDIDLSFPWSQSQLANYIVSCSLEGHKQTTVQSNLSHIRMAHQMQGYDFSADCMMTKMLLTGLKNSMEGGLKRLAMSPRLLILAKHRLKASTMTVHDKLDLDNIHLVVFWILPQLRDTLQFSGGVL